MTAAPADLEATDAAADGAPRPAEDDGRGSLSIADRVVDKIAGRAVVETEYATGTGRRRLSFGGDTDQPQVSAHVDGTVATVSVEFGVTWPHPVADVTRAVRRNVTERLRDLAGVQVVQVDVRVTALPAAQVQVRRVS